MLVYCVGLVVSQSYYNFLVLALGLMAQPYGGVAGPGPQVVVRWVGIPCSNVCTLTLIVTGASCHVEVTTSVLETGVPGSSLHPP